MTLEQAKKLSAAELASMTTAERDAVMKLFKNEKGVLIVNGQTCEELNAKLKGTNASVTVYENQRGIKKLTLLVNPVKSESGFTNSDGFFALEGGRKADNHEAPIVDALDRIKNAIKIQEANVVALKALQTILSSK